MSSVGQMTQDSPSMSKLMMICRNSLREREQGPAGECVRTRDRGEKSSAKEDLREMFVSIPVNEWQTCATASASLVFTNSQTGRAKRETDREKSESADERRRAAAAHMHRTLSSSS